MDALPAFHATHAISPAESAWGSSWFRILRPELGIDGGSARIRRLHRLCADRAVRQYSDFRGAACGHGPALPDKRRAVPDAKVQTGLFLAQMQPDTAGRGDKREDQAQNPIAITPDRVSSQTE